MNRRIKHFKNSRSGLITLALICLAAAYGFASLSIDRGSLWWYLLTLVFLYYGLKNFFQLIGTFFHGKHSTN